MVNNEACSFNVGFSQEDKFRCFVSVRAFVLIGRDHRTSTKPSSDKTLTARTRIHGFLFILSAPLDKKSRYVREGAWTDNAKTVRRLQQVQAFRPLSFVLHFSW
jgi:hypothetical protein